MRLGKLSKPQGEGNKILKDSESLGPLFHFDETIRFDKIVEIEKRLALSCFLKYILLWVEIKIRRKRS
jgi:hypothetical protein